MAKLENFGTRTRTQSDWHISRTGQTRSRSALEPDGPVPEIHLENCVLCKKKIFSFQLSNLVLQSKTLMPWSFHFASQFVFWNQIQVIFNNIRRKKNNEFHAHLSPFYYKLLKIMWTGDPWSSDFISQNLTSNMEQDKYTDTFANILGKRYSFLEWNT